MPDVQQRSACDHVHLASDAGAAPGHAAFADRLAEAFGEDGLADAVHVLERLSKVLDQLGPPVTEP